MFSLSLCTSNFFKWENVAQFFSLKIEWASVFHSTQYWYHDFKFNPKPYFIAGVGIMRTQNKTPSLAC